MKKNILMLLLLLFSCSREYDESKDFPSTNNKIVPVEIIKTQNNRELSKLEKEKLEKLSLIEKQSLDKEGIDLIKFVEIIEKAEQGDKDSIIIIASIYDKINLKSGYDKALKLAVEYKVDELIRIEASEKITASKLVEAEKYIRLLDKNNKDNRNILLIYNEKKADKLIANKQYEKSLTYLKEAYKYGSKNSSLNIAFVYLYKQDRDNALKWFKEAYKYNKREAGYEIAVIYYNEKNYEEALKYLLEQDKLGEEKLSGHIAICYYRLANYEEAYKWFEKAKQDGNNIENIDKFIDEINSNRKGSYNVN